MTMRDQDFEYVGKGSFVDKYILTVDEPANVSGVILKWKCGTLLYTSRMLTKDTADGNIVAISATQVQLTIANGDLDDFDAGSHYHELEASDPAGNAVTLCTGHLAIEKGII